MSSNDEIASLQAEIARLKTRLSAAERAAVCEAAMLNASQDAIVSMDQAGNIVEWNAAAERVFGWTRGEVIGRELAEVIVPEPLRAKHREGLRRYVATGETRVVGTRVEMSALRATGETFPAEISLSRTLAEGAPFVTGFIRDISARRATETTLDATEKRLHAILNTVPVILFSLDRNGIITFSAGRGLDALGVRTGELVGRSAIEMYHDVPWVRAALKRALAGESFSLVGEVGGVWFDTLYAPLRGDGGTLEGILAVSTIITEQKRGERELAETVSLLRATIESTTDGILVVDLGGRITSFNRKFVEMWRIPDHVVESKDDNVALDWVLDQLAAPEAFLAKVRELYAHTEEESFDVLHFRDGRVFERFSRPQRIDGRPVGRVWSFRDVTEHRRNEEERKRLLSEERAARFLAENAVRARDEFVSIASHELRTPLTSLQLALHTALRVNAKSASEGTLDPIAANAIEVAARQGRRLERLIDCLLDISRLDTGQFHLDLASVNLSQLVQDVVLQSKPELEQAGCAISVSLDPSAVGEWDRARIEQVVMNLLSNAIKYGAGRPIAVSVEGVMDDIELRVRDQGIGISHDVCDRVFERFERAVSPRHYGGLGLGLYIVRRIVEAHAGTIRVESEVGIGSTFVTTLPRRVAPVSAP